MLHNNIMLQKDSTNIIVSPGGHIRNCTERTIGAGEDSFQPKIVVSFEVEVANNDLDST